MAAFFAGSRHGAGCRRRRKARRHDDGKAAAPRRVNRAAHMQRTDVHVHRGGCGPPAHRGKAERRVKADMLMRNRDEPHWIVVTMRPRLGDGFLVKADLRAGGEKQMVDTARHHGRDDRVAGGFDGCLDRYLSIIRAHLFPPPFRTGHSAQAVTLVQ